MDLFTACKNGHFDIVKSLVTTDINTIVNYGLTPLHIAACEGHYNICDLLIEHGADVNAMNAFLDTTLDFAIDNGHYDIAKLLLKNGAIDNKDIFNHYNIN